MNEATGAEKERIPLWLWPNVLGLDAPLVAVAWQSFFASAFRIKLPASSYCALALVVWVIYSADHLLDSRQLRRADSAAHRHRFYHRYFTPLALLTSLAAAAAAFLVLTVLPANLVRAASVLGIFVIVYFIHRLWVRGPMLLIVPKEVFSGFVFAMGATLMGNAASNEIREGLVSFELIAFGSLCALNCLAISFWERESDRENDPNAIAQLWPAAARGFSPFAWAVTACLAALTILQRHSPGFPILLAATAGALLIAALAARAGHFRPATLRVLADVAVLLPALALLPMTPWAST